MRTPLLLLFASVFACSPTYAQQQDQTPNGISVGRAKVFDNRSLVLMLEQLNASLRTAMAFDTKGLLPAIGQLQGSQQTEVIRAFDVTLTPTPALPQASNKPATKDGGSPAENTASSASSGGDSKASGKSSIGAKQPSDSTQKADGSASTSDPSKKFGLSAEDLLSEQVDLAYQIYNLQLLLERAQTDRLYSGKPRLQAVLGFEISLDPPKRFRNAAAVIEITITPDSKGEPSVVALMPREKTYNYAVLDKHSNAFSGAVLAKVIQVGFTDKRSGTTYFLYKDSDTFAFDRQQHEKQENAVTFGWQFRPVFDRQSIQPGVRQVFAVIAMPNDIEQKPNLKIEVNTYWTQFYTGKGSVIADKKRNASGDHDAYMVPLFSSDGANEGLAAKSEHASWHLAGSEGVLIDVLGTNFYSGTTAIIGNSVLDSPSKGLLLKSDRRLQILTTQRAFAASDGLINGRYGPPSDIREAGFDKPDGKPGWGAEIQHIKLGTDPERNNATIDIDLIAKCVPGKGQDLAPPDLRNREALISIGGNLVSGYISQPNSVQVTELDKNCTPVPASGSTPRQVKAGALRLRVEVSKDLVLKEQPVRVRVPFLGHDFDDRQFVYPGLRVDKVVRTSEGDPTVLDILGADFRGPIHVLADKDYQVGQNLQLFGSSVMRLAAPKKDLTPLKQIIVYRVQQGAVQEEPIVAPISSVAEEKAGLAKPAFTGKSATVKAGAIQAVTFQGQGLAGVSNITCDGEKLLNAASSDGKTLTVHLTSKVTQHAGQPVELIATDSTGKIIDSLIVNVLPKEATDATAGQTRKSPKTTTKPPQTKTHKKAN